MLGLVTGPIFAVMGSFLLVTFGRALHLEAARLWHQAAALSVLIAGLCVGAARWGSPDLDHIRGAQAVLGPALLVGPPQAALSNALAAAAGFVGAGAWLGSVAGRSRLGWIGYGLETILVALAFLTVFWWPAAHSGGWATGSVVSVIVGVVLGSSLATFGTLLPRSPGLERVALAVAGVTLVVGIWYAGPAP